MFWGRTKTNFCSMEISLSLQILQIGPIKQCPKDKSSTNGMNQTLADFKRTQLHPSLNL